MEPAIAINLTTEHARLTSIATLLHEVNERLCELYKRDYIYVDSPAMYKKLVKLNDKLLSNIAKKTSTTQKLSFSTIADLPEANQPTDSDQGPDLELLQNIEIKLCEACERYEAILDNNPFAKQSFKEFFRPLKIEMVGFVKSARRTVYSYC